MKKKKDAMVETIERMLREDREDNAMYGRSDYRRGHMDALRHVLLVRKEHIRLEHATVKEQNK